MLPTLILIMTLLPPPITQEVLATAYHPDSSRELTIIHNTTIPPIVETLEEAQPASTPKSKPPPPPSSPGVEQWRTLITTHFPSDQVERALCIMAAESGGNPNADNSSSSAAGLFQFLRSTWDEMVPPGVTGGPYSSGAVYNPEANIRAAAWLQSAIGWSQWSPYQRGACH